MKTAFLILLAFALTMGAKAVGTYQYLNSPYKVVYTNTVFSLSITNAGATNYQGTANSVNHTFENFYTVAGTNACTNFFDCTIDPSGSQWITRTSFVYTASGSNEFQATGKWLQWRVRSSILSTNTSNTNTVFYIGE